jgi:hypothetical protein
MFGLFFSFAFVSPAMSADLCNEAGEIKGAACPSGYFANGDTCKAFR